VLGETRRYEQMNRGAQKLIVTAGYDGLEVIV
jgi:hypothetical protein